ncbi:MAG: polyphosphate kinase 1, partial [Huintestinicola sp.]
IFGRGERQKMYISSADFMTRNTVRRVEVAAPIYSALIQKQVLDIFNIMLRDNVKARIQQPDGSYEKVRCGEDESPLNAQEYFIEEAARKADSAALKMPVKVKVRKVRR